MKPKFTVYSRAHCHLCEAMISGLQAMQAAVPFEIDVVDIDREAELSMRYNERVPVLSCGGTEICHYHLDIAKVNEYLRKFG